MYVKRLRSFSETCPPQGGEDIAGTEDLPHEGDGDEDVQRGLGIHRAGKEQGSQSKFSVRNPAICESMKTLDFVQDMDLRAEKERQRSALLRLRELSSAADRDFADKCEALVVRGLGLTPPVLSRLEMQVRNAWDCQR